MKKTVLVFLVGILLAPFWVMTSPQLANAACTTELSLLHSTGGSGPPTTISSSQTVVFYAGDTFALHYEITDCTSPIGRTGYTLSYSYNGSSADIKNESINGSVNENYDLQTPSGNATYSYNLKVSGVGRGEIANVSLTINYELASNSGGGGGGSTSSGDYTPQKLAVCGNDKNSVTVYWVTKSPAISEVEYAQSPGGTYAEKKGTKLMTTHSIAIPGLDANATYSFRARSLDKNGNRVAESPEREFTVHQGDPGCSDYLKGKIPASTGSTSNANENTNKPPATHPDANTTVGATIGNLDEEIGTFPNLLNINSLPELITALIRILFILIGVVSVIVIIIAGYRMVVDSGNEAQMKAAKQAITWAVIGLVVSLLAFSIVAIVQKIITKGQ